MQQLPCGLKETLEAGIGDQGEDFTAGLIAARQLASFPSALHWALRASHPAAAHVATTVVRWRLPFRMPRHARR